MGIRSYFDKFPNLGQAKINGPGVLDHPGMGGAAKRDRVKSGR